MEWVFAVLLFLAAGVFLLRGFAHARIGPVAAAGVIIGVALWVLGVDWWWLMVLVCAIAYIISLFGFRKTCVVLLVAAVASVVCLNVFDNGDSGDMPYVDDANASTTSTTYVQPPENCVERYNVVLDPNDGEKVISEGLSSQKTAQEKLDFVMAKAQHDPRVLKVTWNSTPAGEKNPVTDWHVLVENGCYSQFGRDLYQRDVGVYQAAAVKLDEAPSSGNNTGATPGGDVHQIPGDIGGDRSGIKVTFPNGKEIWIMNRCGNIVTKGNIPGLPVKPPPSTTPTTPSTTPTTTPTGGKDASLSPVHPNDPDERVRQVQEAPAEVIRPNPGPGTTTTTQAPPPSTLPYNPPQVTQPEPIIPGVPEQPPAGPSQGTDGDHDGIPD